MFISRRMSVLHFKEWLKNNFKSWLRILVWRSYKLTLKFLTLITNSNISYYLNLVLETDREFKIRLGTKRKMNKVKLDWQHLQVWYQLNHLVNILWTLSLSSQVWTTWLNKKIGTDVRLKHLSILNQFCSIKDILRGLKVFSVVLSILLLLHLL